MHVEVIFSVHILVVMICPLVVHPWRWIRGRVWSLLWGMHLKTWCHLWRGGLVEYLSELLEGHCLIVL